MDILLEGCSVILKNLRAQCGNKVEYGSALCKTLISRGLVKRSIL